MKYTRLIFLCIILFFSFNSVAQLKYNKYDELISYSYLKPEIEKLKKENKINCLELPVYNNDSIFWENNIKYLRPPDSSKKIIQLIVERIGGFSIDTSIEFFNVATRIKIKEGYLWLYKITSPTAFSLGFAYKKRDLKENEYLTIHSNFHDSINGPYEYHLPFELLTTKGRRLTMWICQDTCYASLFGNTLFVEYFNSSRKNLPIIRLFDFTYGYPTNQRLIDAPDWIRKKYPEINFE